MSTLSTKKTIALLSLWLGVVVAENKAISDYAQRLIQRRAANAERAAAAAQASAIECVVYMGNFDDSESEDESSSDETVVIYNQDTMCQRTGTAASTEDHHYVELPEMLELLYEDEIAEGSLVVSIQDGEIDEDEVVWDSISDFKVIQPSDVTICRVGVVDTMYQDATTGQMKSRHQTECIPMEHGLEASSHTYRMDLTDDMTRQFGQAIEEGILYLSMKGVTISGNELNLPASQEDIKVLVLSTEEDQ